MTIIMKLLWILLYSNFREPERNRCSTHYSLVGGLKDLSLCSHPIIYHLLTQHLCQVLSVYLKSVLASLSLVPPASISWAQVLVFHLDCCGRHLHLLTSLSLHSYCSWICSSFCSWCVLFKIETYLIVLFLPKWPPIGFRRKIKILDMANKALCDLTCACLTNPVTFFPGPLWAAAALALCQGPRDPRIHSNSLSFFICCFLYLDRLFLSPQLSLLNYLLIIL